MNRNVTGHNRPASDHLHPLIFKGMGCLALVFVVSAWNFAGDDYSAYLLAIVIGFVLFTIAIPYVLWRIWSRNRLDADEEPREPFGDWASSEITTGQDRVKGWNAAVEALLPIAAVAFCMAAFGIVLHFT